MTSCMTSTESLKLSVPQFLHLRNGSTIMGSPSCVALKVNYSNVCKMLSIW